MDSEELLRVANRTDSASCCEPRIAKDLREIRTIVPAA